MNGLPPTLIKVIESFSKFPGIGKKTAHRLGLYVLKSNRNDIVDFANSLIDVKNKINTCNNCHNISEQDLCDICSDERRDKSLICICEESSDIYLIEKTGYNGLYHVLGGLLSPLDGINPEDLNIESLLIIPQKAINQTKAPFGFKTSLAPSSKIPNLKSHCCLDLFVRPEFAGEPPATPVVAI